MLVLGAGGVLGEAWLSGVLGGIEDAAGVAFAGCEYLIGTSAGALVCARLAGAQPLERPPKRDRAEPPPASAPPHPAHALAGHAAAWALTIGSPLVPLGLALAAPGGALARMAALRTLRRPEAELDHIAVRVDAFGVRFDGRLRVTAVARASGRRVVFGRPGAPAASVGAAVAASCTVPWLFRPRVINGVEYVDGGVWSPTNLDAAPAARGMRVLCLSPTAGVHGSDPLIAAVRRLSRSVTAIEAAALRARGAQVTVLTPDAASTAAIGTDLMAREHRSAVLAAAYAQGMALARTN